VDDVPAAAVTAAPAPAVAWPWRLAALAATLAAALLFAAAFATIAWRLFAPAPSPAPVPEDAARPSAVLAEYPPFGRAGPAAAATPARANAATGSGDARLLGVFAGRDGEGYALFRLPDRGPILARAGQNVAPGLDLVAVRPDGVRVRDRGDEHDIVLRAATLAAGSVRAAPTAAVNAAPARSRSACAVPPGYRGPVYQVNAELLGGLAARPDSWRAMVASERDSLVVRDDSGVAAMLGLKTGDRLLTASGIALAAPDDLLAAVVRPLQASQPVRVAGTRDGKALEWLLVNAAACAP
jgi:hypothetical protein